MGICHSSISNVNCKILALLIILLFVFSGCNARENTLASREAAVSARETELVTLFSELLKERKKQESDQTDQKNKKNTSSEQAVSDKATGTEKTENSKIVLGGLENVLLDPPSMEFGARIDTGAQTSSLNALDLVEFERDGKPYVKFYVINPKTNDKIELTRLKRSHVRVKEKDIEAESQRRPVIRLRVKLGNIDELIDFTLVDRSNFKQQVLIGRNFLRDLAIVDVSKEYTVPSTDNTDVSINNAK